MLPDVSLLSPWDRLMATDLWLNRHCNPNRSTEALPSNRPLRMQDAIDLTVKVTAEGTLDWDVPPGKWKVVRK